MAGDRRTQEPTALESAATGFVDRAKSGQLLTPRAARWLGIALVAALALGVWFYLRSANHKASSRTWADYAELTDPTQLADYAARNKDTPAGRVARLERARQQFGPGGVATLAGSDRAARLKGIENIVAARDEFVKLAGDFAGDETMSAVCYAAAAEAELALVGIPKDATSPQNFGTVEGAVEKLAEAVKVVGEKSKAGEMFMARIAKLQEDAPKLLAAGVELNNRFSPPPAFTAPLPGGVNPPPGSGILAPPGSGTPSTSRGTPSTSRGTPSTAR